MNGWAVLAVTLLATVAVLDGMFAGFRASCGRTGLVRHHDADRLALRRGLVLLTLTLAPVVLLVLASLAADRARVDDYVGAVTAMVAVYVPYGAVVLLALAGYATLPWRLRFLASAVLLGPLTLVRPLVAVLGAVLACLATGDPVVRAAALAAAVAVLVVEPLAGRLWYDDRPSRVPAVGREISRH